jgi:hypothetical protein
MHERPNSPKARGMSRLVKHLTATDAADFVRGVSAAPARRRIEQHLMSGCARCARTLMLYRAVASTAREEAQWDPPAPVLERAVDMFAIPARRVEPLTRRLLPKLIFDSVLQPLPAGVRASNSLTRHVLYRAGDFFIDLRIDREHGAPRVSIVGQVAPREAPTAGTPLAAVSVLLIDRRAVVARPPVNAFGEFHFDYDAHAQVRLRILFGEQTGLDLPLSRLLKPASNHENAGRET